MSIAEKLVTIAENQQKVFDAGGLAQCPKHTVSGKVISITDIAQIEHNVKVDLSRKNLINADKFVRGSTFVKNEDGSYTFTKENDSNRSTNFVKLPVSIPVGTKVYFSVSSIEGTATGASVQVHYKDDSYVTVGTFYPNDNRPIPLTLTKEIDEIRMFFSQTEADGVYLNISGIQLEVGTSATSYVPYVEDLNDVKLHVFGKNLFNHDTSLLKEITYTTSSGVILKRIGYDPLELPAGTYTFTLTDLDTSITTYVYGMICDKDNKFIRSCALAQDTDNRTPLTIDINEGERIFIYNGYDDLNLTERKKEFDAVQIQLEIGRNSTEYEPYKEHTIYTQNADGNITDIKSIYPNMTLLPSKQGVLIDCEYHLDGLNAGIKRGKQEEWNTFWDAFQVNGTRVDYSAAFRSWFSNANFKPKYSMAPTNAANMFFGSKISGDLEQMLKEFGVTLDLSKATNIGYVFSQNQFTVIPEVNFTSVTSSTNSNGVFGWHSNLKIIRKVIIPSDGSMTFTSWFTSDSKLEEVYFEGVIGKNMDLQHSTKLCKASIENIISCLSDTASGQTLTLSKTAVNNAFETSAGAANGSTSEEWITLITPKSNAYDGLWTITLK